MAGKDHGNQCYNHIQGKQWQQGITHPLKNFAISIATISIVITSSPFDYNKLTVEIDNDERLTNIKDLSSRPLEVYIQPSLSGLLSYEARLVIPTNFDIISLILCNKCFILISIPRILAHKSNHNIALFRQKTWKKMCIGSCLQHDDYHIRLKEEDNNPGNGTRLSHYRPTRKWKKKIVGYLSLIGPQSL